MRCLVCETDGSRLFAQVDAGTYWRCPHCLATFLDPSQHPTLETEAAQYRLHRNDPTDARYRRFLWRLAGPLLRQLPPAQSGLDYGCGPGPALAQMLEEHGHRMALFDPIFAPDRAALNQHYDFITCTETAEHFHRPAEEFRRLDRCLKPGGWLALMTAFQTDDARFADWHYRRDPTHVVFYRVETLQRLADRHGWRCFIPRDTVALMKKS